MRGAEFLRSTDDALACRAGLYLNPRLDALRRDRVLSADFPDLSPHFWIASSGTSGEFKVIALSRSAMETSAEAVNRHLGVTGKDCWLNALPLFHVGGLGVVMRSALAGSRYEMMTRWDPVEFAVHAAHCGATLSSLVPAQVKDLASAGIDCPPSLRAVVVGGGALDESLRGMAAGLGWPLLPSFGMTEAASQVATAAAGARDFAALPLLHHLEARTSPEGLLELRGPSMLSGWMIFRPDGSIRWEDPKIGGWFRTSDICELRDGRLRFVARADELLKIRGELVDVAALERALQARVSSGLVRIDVGPDERTGAVLGVVAENASAQAEARGAEEVFPPYARPSFYRVGLVALSPLGKKLRAKR